MSKSKTVKYSNKEKNYIYSNLLLKIQILVIHHIQNIKKEIP